MAKNRRKLVNFWLDPKLQGKFGFYFLIYGLVNAGVFAGFFYYWSQSVISSAQKLHAVAAGHMTQELARFHMSLNDTLIAFVVVQILLMAGAVIASILFSHRVSGPVYAIRKVINEFRDGRQEARIRLRQKDELSDLANEINGLLDDFEKIGS